MPSQFYTPCPNMPFARPYNLNSPLVRCQISGRRDGRFVLRRGRSRPQMIDDIQKDRPADDKQPRKYQCIICSAIKKIPDRKQRRPNRHATRNPAQRCQSHVIAMQRRIGLAHARFDPDLCPTRPRRMHLFIKRHQSFPACWRDSTNAVITQHNVVKATEYKVCSANGGEWPDFFNMNKHHGDRERTHHRHHFAPRIDAPPKPAQQIKQSRSRADRNQNFKRILRRSQQRNSTTPPRRKAPPCIAGPYSHNVFRSHPGE